MSQRGALVTVALRGDYGKPRPALVIQSDLFAEHPSVTVLPITGELRETPLFRITIEPTPGNGLQKTSQIMIDKAHTVSSDKLGQPFGQLGTEDLRTVDWALAGFLGLI